MWLPGTITVPMYRVSSMVSVSASNQIALINPTPSESCNNIFKDFSLGALLASNSSSCIKKDGSSKSEGHQPPQQEQGVSVEIFAIRLHVRCRQNTQPHWLIKKGSIPLGSSGLGRIMVRSSSQSARMMFWSESVHVKLLLVTTLQITVILK
jgi:hypothetical protein